MSIGHDVSGASAVRHLVLVLGDQLDRRSAAFDGFDAARDLLWMAEAAGEAEHVWSTKARIAVFLAAMRHFAAALRAEGLPLAYRALAKEPPPAADPLVPDALDGALAQSLQQHRPQRIVLVEPGEWRVREALRTVADAAGVPIEFREDRHFFCGHARFEQHANARGQLRMEFFYREMRREHVVLMDTPEKPAGGRWNFDAENRAGFGAKGPGLVPPPWRAEPDAVTREVLALVDTRFAHHPGTLDHFAWPVTRADALAALEDFVAHRLPSFGRWQDAMWSGEPFLYHALVSSALNLKLLDPREVVAAVERAYREGRVDIAAAEGFIRQVLGWREYVRGVYWLHMPEYLERNALGATADLPAWYWTGETDMACLADVIGRTLAHGYAHHIERLMVTGLYALLLGVHPQQVHAWYLAVYVDAVEWVELPNTLGMSQYGDGGVMASKPYVASGQYIRRMSNHCAGCRFDPAQRTGPEACPFTTLYWDFLARHRTRLETNPRMVQMLRNLDRIPAAELQAIQAQAGALRAAAA